MGRSLRPLLGALPMDPTGSTPPNFHSCCPNLNDLSPPAPMLPDWMYIRIDLSQPGGTWAPSRSPPISWWSERHTDSSMMIVPGIWTCLAAKEAGKCPHIVTYCPKTSDFMYSVPKKCQSWINVISKRYSACNLLLWMFIYLFTTLVFHKYHFPYPFTSNLTTQHTIFPRNSLRFER